MIRSIVDAAHPGRSAPTLVVMLPGAYGAPEDFVRAGFVAAVRERQLDIDLVFAPLELHHVADRTLLTRLRRELLSPARAQGRTLWLGGISFGAFLALSFAERHPGELDGLCVFAPYLGTHLVTGEIARARGVDAWLPGEPPEDDEERRVWRFIRTLGSSGLPIHLGLGREDRFGERHRLMAAALTPANVDIVPGGHDWPTWRRLWDRFLDLRLASHPRITRMSASSDSSVQPESAPRAPAAVRRRWRPAPLISGSVALHVAAAGAALARPQWWPWALSAVVADHLLLTGAGLWPRSRLLGPNWTRLPPAAGAGAAAAIALTLDDGPDPDITPRVLELLDEHRARATFFCVGERVTRHPELAREIVQRGHAIENHSQRHLHRFALLGPRALTEEIARAQQAILSATGEVAQFFRAPAGLRNPFLEPVLARANLRLVSWTRRGLDTLSGSAGRVLGRLTRHLAGGDILLLHDGHAAHTAAGSAVILEVLPPLLAAITAAGLTPVTLRAAADRAARSL